MFKNRRIGEFIISSMTINHRPELAKKVLKNILILKADIDPAVDGIRYMGISKNFRELEGYTFAPFYEWEEKDGKIIFTENK